MRLMMSPQQGHPLLNQQPHSSCLFWIPTRLDISRMDNPWLSCIYQLFISHFLEEQKAVNYFSFILLLMPKYHAFTHTTLEIVWAQWLLADEGIDLDISEPPTKK